jgi:hypothetical protein
LRSQPAVIHAPGWRNCAVGHRQDAERDRGDSRLASRDADAYRPTAEPNTHWKYWINKQRDKMPVRLNDKQKLDAQLIADGWLQQCLRVDPIARQEARNAIGAVYAAEGLPAPQFEFCASPREALEQVRQRLAISSPADASKAPAPDASNLLAEFSRYLTGSSDTGTIPAFSPQSSPLGPEVDIVAHHIFREATVQVPINLLPPQTRRAVENLGRIHFCVEQALSAATRGTPVHWVVYCVASGVNAAADLVRIETIDRCGLAPVGARFALVRNALFSAWSFYPFEKLCLVCDRPERIDYPDLDSSDGSKVVTVRFRDGFQAQFDCSLLE